jgi:hypothetical protein
MDLTAPQKLTFGGEDRFIFGVLYSIFSVVKFQFRLFNVTDIS